MCSQATFNLLVLFFCREYIIGHLNFQSLKTFILYYRHAMLIICRHQVDSTAECLHTNYEQKCVINTRRNYRIPVGYINVFFKSPNTVYQTIKIPQTKI